MSTVLFVLIIILGIIIVVSSTRWNLCKKLRKDLDSSYTLYSGKRVAPSAKLAAGDSFAIPMRCTVLLKDNEMHIIPERFHPFLFMTDYPFSFYRKDNRKVKVDSSNDSELVLTLKKRTPSVFGKVFEVRIELVDEERKDLLKKVKGWR